MKQLSTTLCLLMLAAVMQAQFSQPAITFENLNHNFGVVMEAEGVVEHTFTFTNTGSEPLIITGVKTTCGCTVPEWSKEPIMPMKKGTIRVTFDPINRPGAFRKEIHVTSNGREPNTTLYIVGLVKPKTRTVYDDYPIQMNQVRFESNHLSVTKISSNEIKTDTLNMYNDSDSPVTVTVPEHPEHLRFEFLPATMNPKQKGAVVVHYDASLKKDWGFVMDKVFLHFSGVRFEKNLLAVSATIEESFDDLSAEELARAPRMLFSEEVFNFGTIAKGKEIDHVFSFENAGKQKLVIHKMSSTCGCTASEPSAWEIGPGEKGSIQVSFNSAGKIGKQFHTVTLITNDPHKPTKMLRVIGTVENN